MPNLQWFKQDGTSLSLLSNSSKYVISHTTVENFARSFLVLSETNPFDTAMYVCEACNIVGNDLHGISLEVKGETMLHRLKRSSCGVP